MTAKLLEETVTLGEQRLILPGYYTWEQFEAIESLMADSSTFVKWELNIFL